MRFAPGALLATLALLCCCAASAAATITPAAAATPTCAEGPTTVGDTTIGTPCADLIVVPPGVETVKGGGGDDVIVPAPIAASEPCPEGCHLGVGSQTFEGGPGNDVVFGDRGNDILRGGEGNDRLYGGIGDDLLEGGPGDDVLSGGFGADGIDGGPGNDYVRGDGTQDEIVDTGPATDVDTLSYSTGTAPGFTRPVANPGFPGQGGERGVYLDLAANIADNGVAPNGGGVDQIEGSDFERIVGSPFSDYIVGSKPGQQIYGGGGADVLAGGGAGTQLYGGADGDDCSGEGTPHECESTAVGGPVTVRDTSKVSVGLMTPSVPSGEAQAYLVGGSGDDSVSVSYSPAAVTFNLSGGSFDTSAADAGGCELSGGEARCPLQGALDSVLIAGMGGGDTLNGDGLPQTTSLVVSGGAGNDTVTGGEASDDTLVDGPGNDTLHGLGGDDALLNNEGSDSLFGEAGSDLFLSNAICEGDYIDGGEFDRDNASWAKFGEGIDARLDQGLAGRPGPGGEVQCAGGTPDSLTGIEDLEGTFAADVLYGDAEANQLLGHLGADTYFSGGGEDTILANSGDFDPTIDCGEEEDTAIIDRAPFGDVAAADCENVFEADPNDFRLLTKLPRAVAPPPPKADVKPPQTRISAHPRKLIEIPGHRRRVVFRFASSERGSSFSCKLDRKPYRPCASPRAYTVARGPHTFRVAATDPAGNVDPSPVLFHFRVIRRQG
jgi:Ca2+-binding RTX toxin-like protein